MFLSLLGKCESGRLCLKLWLNTSRYAAKLYWYIELMAAISESTKKRTAPRRAAGL